MVVGGPTVFCPRSASTYAARFPAPRAARIMLMERVVFPVSSPPMRTTVPYSAPARSASAVWSSTYASAGSGGPFAGGVAATGGCGLRGRSEAVVRIPGPAARAGHAGRSDPDRNSHLPSLSKFVLGYPHRMEHTCCRKRRTSSIRSLRPRGFYLRRKDLGKDGRSACASEGKTSSTQGRRAATAWKQGQYASGRTLSSI